MWSSPALFVHGADDIAPTCRPAVPLNFLMTIENGAPSPGPAVAFRPRQIRRIGGEILPDVFVCPGHVSDPLEAPAYCRLDQGRRDNPQPRPRAAPRPHRPR